MQEIVAELERDGVDLDRALRLFEEGVERLRTATAELTRAEASVKLLVERTDGSFELPELGRREAGAALPDEPGARRRGRAGALAAGCCPAAGGARDRAEWPSFRAARWAGASTCRLAGALARRGRRTR
jgi:exodeoxyribonuclease VII small subunit